MKNKSTYLLLGLLALSGVAQAACINRNTYIGETRPNDRYETLKYIPPGGVYESEVRDKVTGLVWQRCVVGMTWNGTNCTGTAEALSWSEALKLVQDMPLWGEGWRMPNYVELSSLVERACDSPAINTHLFPGTPTGWSWSSSPSASNKDDAWSVLFINGQIEPISKISTPVNLRLVRSGL